jgi:prevent-host-death family protein
MQTYSATSVAKNCWAFLDAVQSESIIITKKNRPVAVTMSYKRAKELENAVLEAGIQRGLDDIKAGRWRILTEQYANEMLEEFTAQYISRWK